MVKVVSVANDGGGGVCIDGGGGVCRDGGSGVCKMVDMVSVLVVEVVAGDTVAVIMEC